MHLRMLVWKAVLFSPSLLMASFLTSLRLKRCMPLLTSAKLFVNELLTTNNRSEKTIFLKDSTRSIRKEPLGLKYRDGLWVEVFHGQVSLPFCPLIMMIYTQDQKVFT